MLTDGRMRLAVTLRQRRIEVLEGYPGGSQDLLGTPRKRAGVAALQRHLVSLGLGGDLAKPALTHDALDAVTFARAGGRHHRGVAILTGSPKRALRSFLDLRGPDLGRDARPLP